MEHIVAIAAVTTPERNRRFQDTRFAPGPSFHPATEQVPPAAERLLKLNRSTALPEWRQRAA